jgi:hypothetical protein
VSGVLRAELDGAPLEGVVVTATRLTDRVLVARAITAASGTFRLRVGRDSVVVQALRIGQQPVELWRGQLPPGAREDVGRRLADVPVSLTSLHIQERARCGPPEPGERSVARTLFADALTALLAAMGSPDAEALSVRVELTEASYDLRGQRQRVESRVQRTGANAQPFRSVPVQQLMREGFAVSDPDGGMSYRAPDAQTLTSDLFLRNYCLSLDLTRETTGLVGIRFAPQRSDRTRVDVRGVLWLDLPSRALRSMEFGYVGLPSEVLAADPGGVVEYVRLADGRWILDRWSLRMPTMVTERVPAPNAILGTTPRVRATGVKVVGGTVLEARLRNAILYSAGGAGAAARDAAGELEDDQGNTCLASESGEGWVLGLVRRPDGTPAPGALVEAEWETRYVLAADGRSTRERGRAEATTGADGRFMLCGVPSDERVAVTARTESTRSRALQLRLPAGSADGWLELVLLPPRFGVVTLRSR